MNAQPGILAPVPRLARYLSFQLRPDSNPTTAVTELAELADGDKIVVGLGASLLGAMDQDIDALDIFPGYSSVGFDVPSTPFSLWCWLRHEDRGEHVHVTHTIEEILGDAFDIVDVVDAFQYRDSRDLTGYIDGTENPEGDEAVAAAIVQGEGVGMDGSSFVAVQQWMHDLGHFQSLPQKEQDDIFGRHISDNEEFDEAPESAHVKRTAQESFSPEAFMLRRSMPWASADGEGLVFTAFGKSFDAFDAVLSRMVGGEDGVTDALFRFTRPITGSYFWCPPMKDGQLDLSAIGL